MAMGKKKCGITNNKYEITKNGTWGNGENNKWEITIWKMKHGGA